MNSYLTYQVTISSVSSTLKSVAKKSKWWCLILSNSGLTINKHLKWWLFHVLYKIRTYFNNNQILLLNSYLRLRKVFTIWKSRKIYIEFNIGICLADFFALKLHLFTSNNYILGKVNLIKAHNNQNMDLNIDDVCLEA